ncbi:MAG TPA: AAA family ATPase [Candidatus Poseidoniaceae archaeon]|nr:MAG TPA: hypothetical protein D7I01_07345 [Candidatus Poseidoniales archaeon]HII97512.1 AAA family ATPase [Candidatus Poseidoniaceae archaeon]
MVRVLAVCGLPACGKGEFAEMASSLGLPVRSMGDMVREEVLRQGLEGDPRVFGRVAMELRAAHGDDVLAVRLADAIDAMDDRPSLLIIDGLRGVAERDIFTARWGDGFAVVAIHAEADVRFKRSQDRGRAEDGSLEDFQARDARELGWGVGQLMEEADHVLHNRDPLSTFRAEARDLLLGLTA